MKKLHRLCSYILAIATALLVLTVTACQPVLKTSSASFSISKNALADIKDFGNDTQNAYCYVITSHGDYEQTWKGNFDFDDDNLHGTARIAGIPVGAEISFTVNVYIVRKGVNYLLLDYTGESETQVIEEGNNHIKVRATDSLLTFCLNIPEGMTVITEGSYLLTNTISGEVFNLNDKNSNSIEHSNSDGKSIISIKKGNLMSTGSNSAILGSKYKLTATIPFMNNDGSVSLTTYEKVFDMESGNQTMDVDPIRSQESQPGGEGESGNQGSDIEIEANASAAYYIGPQLDNDDSSTGSPTYTKVGPVPLAQAVNADIDTTKYMKTIVLSQDCTVTEPIQITKDTAINLNGHRLIWNGNSTASLFAVATDRTLILWDSSSDGSSCITSTSPEGTGSIINNTNGHVLLKNITIKNLTSNAESLIYTEGENANYFILDHVKISNCTLTKKDSKLIYIYSTSSEDEPNDTNRIFLQTEIDDCYADLCSGIYSRGPFKFIGGHINNTRRPEGISSPSENSTGTLYMFSSKDEHHAIIANTYFHSSTEVAPVSALVTSSGHLEMKSTVDMSFLEETNFMMTDGFESELRDTFNAYNPTASEQSIFVPSLAISTDEMQQTSWGEYCFRTGSDTVTPDSYYGEDAIETVISCGTGDFSQAKESSKATSSESLHSALVLGEDEFSRGYLHINSRSTVYGLTTVHLYSYIQQTGAMGSLHDYPIRLTFPELKEGTLPYDDLTDPLNIIQNPCPLFASTTDMTDYSFDIMTGENTEGKTYFLLMEEGYIWKDTTRTIYPTGYKIYYPSK